jgi:hypothetical protein
VGDVLPPSPAPPPFFLSQGSADGVLYCLRALNGTSVWQYRTNDWVVASPTRVLSLVYFAALNGYVYAVWADTGAVRVSQSQSRVRTSFSEIFHKAAPFFAQCGPRVPHSWPPSLFHVLRRCSWHGATAPWDQCGPPPPLPPMGARCTWAPRTGSCIGWTGTQAA